MPEGRGPNKISAWRAMKPGGGGHAGRAAYVLNTSLVGLRSNSTATTGVVVRKPKLLNVATELVTARG